MTKSVEQLIRSHCAVIRMVSAYPNNNNSLKTEFNRVCRPQTNRKSKGDKGGKKVWNPRTGKIEKKPYQGKRGRNKNTIYSKKMSVSLLPTDGKMQPFKTISHIGFLYDLAHCHLKGEKYMWTNNKNTNSRWWRMKPNIPGANGKRKSVGLAGMRAKNNRILQPWQTRNHNEALMGLSKVGLRCLFVTTDTLSERLNLLRVANQNKNDADHCQLWIITPRGYIKPYSIKQQRADIKKADSLPKHHFGRSVLNPLNHGSLTTWDWDNDLPHRINPSNKRQPKPQKSQKVPTVDYTDLNHTQLLQHIINKKEYAHIQIASAIFQAEGRPQPHRNFSPIGHAVTTLCQFIDRELRRLREYSAHDARKKCAAFIHIRRQLMPNNLREDQVKSLIAQTTIVAHHRRHRTRNRLISWFLWAFRQSNSYKNYKRLKFKGAFQESFEQANNNRHCKVRRKTCHNYGEYLKASME